MTTVTNILRLHRSLVNYWFVSMIVLAAQAIAVLAQEQVSHIASRAELQVWLQTVHDTSSTGQVHTAVLAPGTYGQVQIAGQRNGAKIVLRSADTNQPAIFERLAVSDTTGLELVSLTLKYTAPNGAADHDSPFRFSGVSGLVLRDVLIDGDFVRNVPGTDAPYPHGFGINIDRSNDILIEDSEIRNFVRGIVIHRSDNITIRRNDIHAIRSDGLNFAQVSDLLIQGNRIRDFKRAELSSDHSDMIQIWTTGTDAPSRNIAIRDNILNAGTGLYTQSIFIRNEVVDQGISGQEMFYENIEIHGNVIINSHLHGITVGEVNGLAITQNTLVRSKATRIQGDANNHALWTPQINVAPAARDVRIERNAAWFTTSDKRAKDWTMRGNVVISDRDAAQLGHYSKVFYNASSPDPADLANFAYLPAGPLGTGAAGAPMLLP